jgi:hypothetical protein
MANRAQRLDCIGSRADAGRGAHSFSPRYRVSERLPRDRHECCYVARILLATTRSGPCGRVGAREGDHRNRLLRIVRRSSGSVVAWRPARMVLLATQEMDPLEIARVEFISPDRARDVIHNFRWVGVAASSSRSCARSAAALDEDPTRGRGGQLRTAPDDQTRLAPRRPCAHEQHRAGLRPDERQLAEPHGATVHRTAVLCARPERPPVTRRATPMSGRVSESGGI